jgi:acyl-CoA synthetase (AMP-forming)/AMP-acid ligase II
MDRGITKQGRFWVQGRMVGGARFRLADSVAHPGVHVSKPAIPHLGHRGVSFALGKALSADQRDEAVRWWTDVHLVDSTPEQQSIPLPEGHTGSMGWLIDGAEVIVAAPDTLEPLPDGTEGAILVRGYFLLQGMVKREREETFTADGFYNTGDKGYLLGDQLFLKGRLTEMIKTSGNNVSPPEVEACCVRFRT